VRELLDILEAAGVKDEEDLRARLALPVESQKNNNHLWKPG